MDKAVDVKNLNYYYGKTLILSNVSFFVPENNFFIIIGPNGSGKTTLMKILAGIIKPQQGKLKILGAPAESYSRKKLARHISFVPQTIAEDFPFTVMELVLMGRSPYLGLLGLESGKDKEFAMQALSFTGVEHLAKRRIDKLSGGERQRVFIARAICQDPDIILLDEPTASLDIAHQIRIMDLLEKLKEKKKITVIMVSHDINLAAMYAGSLLLLKDGKILNLGIPEDVINFQTLEETYGCTVIVDQSPLGKFPRVTLVPGRAITSSDVSP